MIDVVLSWAQVDLAAQVGCKRYIRALAKGRTENHGASERGGGWNLHILGALGECAAAIALDVFWPMATDPDYAGDLGEGSHVRTTERRDGALILHETDAEGRFVLVVGTPPQFSVVGWKDTVAGRLPSYWRDDVPSPAFFVPQSDLNPFTPPRGPQDG